MSTLPCLDTRIGRAYFPFPLFKAVSMENDIVLATTTSLDAKSWIAVSVHMRGFSIAVRVLNVNIPIDEMGKILL